MKPLHYMSFNMFLMAATQPQVPMSHVLPAFCGLQVLLHDWYKFHHMTELQSSGGLRTSGEAILTSLHLHCLSCFRILRNMVYQTYMEESMSKKPENILLKCTMLMDQCFVPHLYIARMDLPKTSCMSIS